MAKLSTYVKDTSISGEDLLVGSNYIGVDNYATNNFKIKDLADYFAGQITTDPLQLSLKPNGGLVFETINSANYLAVDLSASNITGQLANSDLVNSSITINSTVVSLGGSIDIPVGDITAVEAGTYLNGGGTTGDVTLNHDSTSRSDTTASSTITSTFTAITSITSNATGHITSEETTTYTLPTDIYVNSAAVTGTNTKTITLGRTGGQSNLTANFDDLDTTYSISALATNNNDDALIRLTAGGSGSGTDDVTLAAGTNINLNVTGDTIEIESTAFGNVYEAANITEHINLTTVQGDIVVRTDESKTYIDNGGPDATGASDLSDEYTELQFSGIQNINLTEGDGITLSRTTLTQTNNTLTITNSLATSSERGGIQIGYTENGKNYPVELDAEQAYVNVPWTDNNDYVDGISVTGTATKTITLTRTGSLPDLTADFDDNDTTYSAGVGLVLTGTTFKANLIDETLRSVTAQTITTTPNRTYAVMPDADGDLVVNIPWTDTTANDATITLSAGTYISGGGDFTTDQSANETITFNHDNTTRTNTTSSVSPAHEASFTAIDTITTNATGHVTAVNTKTITLPSDDDNDTTYSISAETATGGANLRLTGSDSTTDDVVYKGNGATTVTRTDANTITISSTDTKQATVWKAVDDDGDQVDIAHNKYLKFVSSTGTAGTNLSGAGTSGNPYVMTITSPNDNTTYSAGVGLSLSGTTFNANVVNNATTQAPQAITTTANRLYQVETDDQDNLVVNVPWVDTDTDTNNYVTGASVTGTATKTLTLTRQGLSDLTAQWTDIDTNTQRTDEEIRDVAAAQWINGTNTTVVVSDANNTIKINATNTNDIDYINAASFSTNTGVLTLSGVGNAGATVDLDGRYLTSYSETDTLATVTARGNSTSTALSLSGDVTFTTNTKLNLGTGVRWQGYHDGSNTYLTNITGNYYIRNTDVNADLFLGINYNGSVTNLITLDGSTRLITLKDTTLIQSSTGNADLYLGNVISASSSIRGARFHSNNADFYFDFQGDSTQNWFLRDYDGSGGIHTRFGFNFINATFTASGDIVAYGSPSDITLKENIKPVEDALNKVEKLQGVTFNWKEPGLANLNKDIGFIAQDVQKVLPELVRENENGKLSLRHQGIVPILLEAIKELSDKVKALENGSTK